MPIKQVIIILKVIVILKIFFGTKLFWATFDNDLFMFQNEFLLLLEIEHLQFFLSLLNCFFGSFLSDIIECALLSIILLPVPIKFDCLSFIFSSL